MDGSDSEDGLNILVPSVRWSAHQWPMFEMWQDNWREGFIPENTMFVELLEVQCDPMWNA